jgi:hypothetical protein
VCEHLREKDSGNQKKRKPGFSRDPAEPKLSMIRAGHHMTYDVLMLLGREMMIAAVTRAAGFVPAL